MFHECIQKTKMPRFINYAPSAFVKCASLNSSRCIEVNQETIENEAILIGLVRVNNAVGLK